MPTVDTFYLIIWGCFRKVKARKRRWSNSKHGSPIHPVLTSVWWPEYSIKITRPRFFIVAMTRFYSSPAPRALVCGINNTPLSWSLLRTGVAATTRVSLNVLRRWDGPQGPNLDTDNGVDNGNMMMVILSDSTKYVKRLNCHQIFFLLVDVQCTSAR